MFGFRKPKNLKDILIRAKLQEISAPSTVKHPCSKYANNCTKSKCDFCPLLHNSGRITSMKTGREYTCKAMLLAKAVILYAALCATYVRHNMWDKWGTVSKKDFLATWVQSTAKNLGEHIGRHFNLPGHHGLNDLEISVLDFIYCPPKEKFAITLRLQIEFNWIQCLRTMLPFSINTKDHTPLDWRCRSWHHYHNR